MGDSIMARSLLNVVHLMLGWMFVCLTQHARASPAYEVVPPILPPSDYNDIDDGDHKPVGNELEWMLMPGPNGDVQLAVLSPPPAYMDSLKLFRPDDVEFFLFTRENKDAPERGYYKASCKPHFKRFSPNRRTKVLIHGFGDSLLSSLMYPLLIDAYLTREDVNVFVVDWARLAGTPWYKTAMGNTQFVGTRVARMIDHLVNSTGANLDHFHIVGFSLGSHVAGIAGRQVTTGRIARITGLDPASVLYGTASLDMRLDGTDAEYVEIVHTSGGYLGYSDPIGQVDFFPNGGTWPQPGCYLDFVAVCSHRRAYYYFNEALRKETGILATECDNFDHFKKGECTKSRNLHLGSEEVPADRAGARGTYYLVTNSDEPYATAR